MPYSNLINNNNNNNTNKIATEPMSPAVWPAILDYSTTYTPYWHSNFLGNFPWPRIGQDSSWHADLEAGHGGLHAPFLGNLVFVPGWLSTQRAISSHSSLSISSGSTSWNGPNKERTRIKRTGKKTSWKSSPRLAPRFPTWGAPYPVNTWWPKSPC